MTFRIRGYWISPVLERTNILNLTREFQDLGELLTELIRLRGEGYQGLSSTYEDTGHTAIKVQ